MVKRVHHSRAPTQKRNPTESTTRSRILKPKEVYELAVEIANRYGVYIKNHKKLLQNLKSGEMTVALSRQHMLWFDRYYIALEDSSKQGFRYLYLTQKHIAEVMRDHQESMRQEGKPVLDLSMIGIFDDALRVMRESGMGYVIRVEGQRSGEFGWKNKRE